MKRTILIAAIIALFMVTSLDLEARHGRNGMPMLVRGGIAIALLSQGPLFNHHNRYDQYQNHQGQQIVREIRRNEKSIWKLQRRIDRLDRHEGNYREMRELEQEINWLERRNDYLRNQLY